MFGGRPRSVWAGVLVALLSFSGLPGLAAVTIAGQTATSVKPAVEAPKPALNCPEVPPSGVGGRPPVGEMKVRVAVDAQTQWRPRRQAVNFTVAGVDFDANVGLFCTYFRWKDDPQPANVWRRTPWQLVAKPSSDETQFSVAVPYDLPNPPAASTPKLNSTWTKSGKAACPTKFS